MSIESRDRHGVLARRAPLRNHADVHGRGLDGLRGHHGSAVPDLLVVADVEVRRVSGGKSLLPHRLDGPQQYGDSDLVVQESGLQIPRLGQLAPGVRVQRRLQYG